MGFGQSLHDIFILIRRDTTLWVFIKMGVPINFLRLMYLHWDSLQTKSV